jgi:signal transduction histidine kinase
MPSRLVVRVQDRIVVSLLTLTLLPIGFVALVAIQLITARVDVDLNRQADASLRLVVSLIDNSQRELMGLARVLADEPGLQARLASVDATGMSALLRQKQAWLQIDQLLVADADGQILAHAEGAVAAGPIERPPSPDQAEARVELQQSQLQIAAVCPVRSADGAVLGVLKLGRAIDREMLEHIHDIGGAHVSLIAAGRVVGTTLPAERGAALATAWTAASPRALHELETSDAPAILELKLGSETLATRVMPLTRDGPRVTSSLMVSLSRAPLRLAHELVAQTILMAALFASVVGVFFGTLLARAITRPIRRLTHAAAALAKGDLNQRVELHSTDELAELGEVFNRMAGELRNLLQKERELAVAKTAAEAEKRKAEDLQRYATELAQSNAELQQFAYVASHDLQEPLRIVASYIQLLSRRYKGQLSQEADEFIGYSVEGVVRMQRLINDLLAYSRVGTHGRSFAPANCQLLYERALTNLRSMVDESQATVTADPLPTVMGDGGQLAQLFQNLLANAIKFRGSDPPRVHVSTVRRGGDWLFAVKDNGIGIEPQYYERVFVIFQRLDRSHAGTGIGLAICKKVVDRHNGRIWVESQLGEGATFYFTLPATVHAAADPLPPPSPSSTTPP